MIIKFKDFLNETVQVFSQPVQNPHPLVVSKNKEVDTDKTRILNLQEKIRKQNILIQKLRSELARRK